MLSHRHTLTPSHPHTVTSDPSLQVRACNLLGGYLTHKETNMRYLSLETLSHLATSDLSREAVKKHQDIVLNSLTVSVCVMNICGLLCIWKYWQALTLVILSINCD